MKKEGTMRTTNPDNQIRKVKITAKTIGKMETTAGKATRGKGAHSGLVVKGIFVT